MKNGDMLNADLWVSGWWWRHARLATTQDKCREHWTIVHLFINRITRSGLPKERYRSKLWGLLHRRLCHLKTFTTNPNDCVEFPPRLIPNALKAISGHWSVRNNFWNDKQMQRDREVWRNTRRSDKVHAISNWALITPHKQKECHDKKSYLFLYFWDRAVTSIVWISSTRYAVTSTCFERWWEQ